VLFYGVGLLFPEYGQGLRGIFFTSLGAFIVALAMIWYMFRFGAVLPQLALGHNHIGFGRAWALTRPHAGSIFGTAVLASGLQSLGMVLLMVSSWWGFDSETGEFSAFGEYATALLYVMFYAFSGLIGAAILTEIYTRIDPRELPLS